MLFKILTVVLVLLVAGETLFFVMSRRATNRFKSVEGYDGLVAFDTATGQLCKALRIKSAARIEQEEQAAKAAKEMEPCIPAPNSGDPFTDAIDRAAIPKRCGGYSEEISEKAEANSTLKFLAGLPTCANIH